MYKNMTLNHNSEKNFMNSERVPDLDAPPDQTTDAFTTTTGLKQDGRSQSRTLGQ